MQNPKKTFYGPLILFNEKNLQNSKWKISSTEFSKSQFVYFLNKKHKFIE